MKSEFRQTLRRRTVLFAAILCLSAALSARAQEWKTYSYSADGFSVSSPSAPEEQKRNVPTDAGSFELRYYVAEDNQTSLMVGVCDYGAQVAGKDPNTLLQKSRDGFLSNTKSHLVNEKKIMLGIYPGLEFDAESDGYHFSARIFMVGTTLYQTLVTSTLGQPYSGTTHFLDSFQVIPRAQG